MHFLSCRFDNTTTEQNTLDDARADRVFIEWTETLMDLNCERTSIDAKCELCRCIAIRTCTASRRQRPWLIARFLSADSLGMTSYKSMWEQQNQPWIVEFVPAFESQPGTKQIVEWGPDQATHQGSCAWLIGDRHTLVQRSMQGSKHEDNCEIAATCCLNTGASL